MHRLGIARRQPVGGIDRGMGAGFQDQQLAGPQQQNLAGGTRLVGLGCPRREFAHHRFQNAQMAQGAAGQRPREAGIARFQAVQGGKQRIQRPLAAQHARDDGQRRLARRQAGLSGQTFGSLQPQGPRDGVAGTPAMDFRRAIRSSVEG
jgi:hypothetical protein